MKPLKIGLKISVFLLVIIALPIRAELYVTVVQGLGGEPAFEESFHNQSQVLVAASSALTDEENVAYFDSSQSTRSSLLSHFESLSNKMNEADRALIYLVGHGSFDGEEYKFNIPGLDLTTSDISNVMASLPGQNHFLFNTSSTSGALLEALTDSNYILVTATRSGNEKNATYFGKYFVEALSDEAADLNKNNSISIEEAFNYAQREVEDYFETQGQLATEHSVIQGQGAAQFTLARINQIVIETENPRVAELQMQSLEIDQKIQDLQLRRNTLENTDYIKQLQALILESAKVNEEIEQLTSE